MKINLIIFLALISISCSSNESDESIKIEGNISPTQTPVSMKEKKVATTPGIVFGENWNKYVRVSLAQTSDIFSQAIDEMVKYIELY